MSLRLTCCPRPDRETLLLARRVTLVRPPSPGPRAAGGHRSESGEGPGELGGYPDIREGGWRSRCQAEDRAGAKAPRQEIQKGADSKGMGVDGRGRGGRGVAGLWAPGREVTEGGRG